jgi:hypothetical protein
MSDTPGTPADDSWKRYPLALGDDPQMVFPDAEAAVGGTANRYAISGRLVGATSGKSWAFLVILSGNTLYGGLHADSCTVSLFDLASGEYATSTELDFPRFLHRRIDRRLSVGGGALDVAFQGESGKTSFGSRRGADAELLPFAYWLHAEGVGADSRRITIDLELDATKPPIPIGGNQYHGVETWMGERETRAYFQSHLQLRGSLSWGDDAEDVQGDCGWIDHQWSAQPTRWRAGRYGTERRQIHLDNGIEIGIWIQVDRRLGNRVIPYTGATAAGPSGEIDATTNVRVENLAFVRDRGEVEALRSPRGPKYFADRQRILVPGWDLDLLSEPIVAAPAHALARDYWNGPTRVRGTLAGREVAGFGFHERTHPLTRDFEIVDVLRQTLRHLPAGTVPAAGVLSDLVWEIDSMISRGDREAAIAFIDTEVGPRLDALPEPHRSELRQIADDTAESLLRWWVRPGNESPGA